MGIRETLNENPRLTTGITVGIIVVVLAWILWPAGGGGVGGGGGVSDQMFYTVDDGKTWFADDADKIPPFQKDGKEAVRAIVYRCGGKTFVNHMERLTPEAQKKLAAMQATGDADAAAASDPTIVESIRAAGLEVRSPGGGEWVRATSAQGQQVLQPKCGGDASDLELVTP